MNYDDERLHGSMQLALGQFVFELGTLAYQDFKRSNDWRHASNSRVGARPAYQFVGVGDDAISLSGWVAPGQVGSYASIAALRAMGDSGQAFALVSGTGEVFGQYVIKQLEETGTYHDRRGRPGRSPRPSWCWRSSDRPPRSRRSHRPTGQHSRRRSPSTPSWV